VSLPPLSSSTSSCGLLVTVPVTVWLLPSNVSLNATVLEVPSVIRWVPIFELSKNTPSPDCSLPYSTSPVPTQAT
jgi:hypothetical protein